MDISVIVPIYNAEEHVERLINMFNQQKGNNFEVLFIDDASTDNTSEVLLKKQKDAKFDCYINILAENVGSGGARNYGIRESRGKYICFIDADDNISHNYLDELYNKALEIDADIVVGNAEKVWDKQKKPHYDLQIYMNLKNNHDALTCVLDDGPCGKLIKRRIIIEEALFFPEKIRAEDKAIMPVIYYLAKKITFAPSAIYYYIQTPGSRSRSNGKYYKDIFVSFQLLENKLSLISPIIIEYKAAVIIGYGVIMNAILHNESNETLRFYTNYLNTFYPKAKHNKYLKHLPLPKRIFIKLAYTNNLFLLKKLVKVAK